MAKAKEAAFKMRIVGEGVERAGDLAKHFNKMNWRKHPPEQLNGMRKVLDSVGWLQRVIVNKKTGNIIDGHLRVEIASGIGDDQPVPVVYVDISEKDERLALATYDSMTALAEVDPGILKALVDDVRGANPTLELTMFFDRLLESGAYRAQVETAGDSSWDSFFTKDAYEDEATKDAEQTKAMAKVVAAVKKSGGEVKCPHCGQQFTLGGGTTQ